MFKLSFIILSLSIAPCVYAQTHAETDKIVEELMEIQQNKAKNYLKKRLSDPYCTYIYGSILLSEKRFKRANKYITKAAEQGLPEAINSIGDGYYSGDIRKKNIRSALENYIKAAQMGYGPAQFNAGVVYYRHGRGLKAMLKSEYWLTKAASNSQNYQLKPYILMCKRDVQRKIKAIS